MKKSKLKSWKSQIWISKGSSITVEHGGSDRRPAEEGDPIKEQSCWSSGSKVANDHSVNKF